MLTTGTRPRLRETVARELAGDPCEGTFSRRQALGLVGVLAVWGLGCMRPKSVEQFVTRPSRVDFGRRRRVAIVVDGSATEQEFAMLGNGIRAVLITSGVPFEAVELGLSTPRDVVVRCRVRAIRRAPWMAKAALGGSGFVGFMAVLLLLPFSVPFLIATLLSQGALGQSRVEVEVGLFDGTAVEPAGEALIVGRSRSGRPVEEAVSEAAEAIARFTLS